MGLQKLNTFSEFHNTMWMHCFKRIILMLLERAEQELGHTYQIVAYICMKRTNVADFGADQRICGY